MKQRTQAELAELEKTAKLATKIVKAIFYAISAMAVVCAIFYNPAHAWTGLLAFALGRFMTFEVDN